MLFASSLTYCSRQLCCSTAEQAAAHKKGATAQLALTYGKINLGSADVVSVGLTKPLEIITKIQIYSLVSPWFSQSTGSSLVSVSTGSFSFRAKPL